MTLERAPTTDVSTKDPAPPRRGLPWRAARRAWITLPRELREPVALAVLDSRIRDRAGALVASGRAAGMSVHVRLPSGAGLSRCFGVADASRGIPLRPSTPVRVMSLSKPVTAMGALALVHRGLIDLDEPALARLAPWTLPPARCGGLDPSGITLRRLLSHSAGLGVLTHGWEERPASTTDLLDGAAGEPAHLVLAPGTSARYSGGGYLLVQALVERLTGLPFALAMDMLVLRPLGMTRSWYEPGPPRASFIARRHDRSGATLPDLRCAAAGPSGLVTTARDMATLFAALWPGPRGEPPGRGVISGALAREVIRVQAVEPPRRRWGLGPTVWAEADDVVCKHGAFREGFWGQAEGLINRRAAIVVLAVGDDAERPVHDLCNELRRLLFRLLPGRRPTP